MCTLIVCRNAFRHYPFVVAANRDERFDRPSRPPELWETGGGPIILAPVDAEAGGTWIGVNDRGVFAAVTNRDGVAWEKDKLSRGELVLLALQERTANDGFTRVCLLEPGLFNGFHLVVADRSEAFLAVGNGSGGEDLDGERIEPAMYDAALGDGVHIITNAGAGPGHSERAKRIRSLFEREARLAPPRPSSLTRLLDIEDRPFSNEPDGSCVYRPELGCGTRSSSVVRLNERGGRRFWEFWHRERPPNGPIIGAKWEKLAELPIHDP